MGETQENRGEREARERRARVKLGPFVRLAELYFALVVVTVLGYALFMPADLFDYDITLVRIVAVMATASCSLWLIEKRARAARRFIVVAMAVVVALSVLDIVFGDEYLRIAERVGVPLLTVAGLVYFGSTIAIILYFAFSPRAKRVFVERLDRSVQPTHDPSENIYEKPFTWPWVRNLVIYYCVFSILGHWAEIGFCWLIVLGVFMGDYDFSHAQLWDQWLYPYPAHGIALVLIVIVLTPLKDWLLKKTGGRVLPALVVSFLANALVCTAIDFTMGITTNADYQLWDYRDLPFNFMGQIVLQNSIVYSIAATLIVWVIYPLMAKGLHRARKSVVDGIFFACIGVYAFLEVLYFIHIAPSGFIFG